MMHHADLFQLQSGYDIMFENKNGEVHWDITVCLIVQEKGSGCKVNLELLLGIDEDVTYDPEQRIAYRGDEALARFRAIDNTQELQTVVWRNTEGRYDELTVTTSSRSKAIEEAVRACADGTIKGGEVVEVITVVRHGVIE